MGTQKIPTSPTALMAYLEYAEVDGSRAGDCRRILREERIRLASALRSGDARTIAAARDEALRVARDWDGF